MISYKEVMDEAYDIDQVDLMVHDSKLSDSVEKKFKKKFKKEFKKALNKQLRKKRKKKSMKNKKKRKNRTFKKLK